MKPKLLLAFTLVVVSAYCQSAPSECVDQKNPSRRVVIPLRVAHQVALANATVTVMPKVSLPAKGGVARRIYIIAAARVDTCGKVRRVGVTQLRQDGITSATLPDPLRSAIKAAVEEWRFKPLEYDGQAQWVEVALFFVVTKDGAELDSPPFGPKKVTFVRPPVPHSLIGPESAGFGPERTQVWRA
jgi:hypothetical protein